MGKILHITHDDADALGCALVAEFIPEIYQDVYFNNVRDADNAINEALGENLDNPNEYEKILITDISISDEMAEKLDKLDIEVELIDHHKTNKLNEKYSWATVESEYEIVPSSASGIIYREYLSEIPLKLAKALKPFIMMIERYDTWEWKNHPQQSLYFSGKEEYINILVRKLGVKFTFDLLKVYILNCSENIIMSDNERKIENLFPEFAYNMIMNEIKTRTKILDEFGKEVVKLSLTCITIKRTYSCRLFLSNNLYTNEKLSKIYTEDPTCDIAISLDPVNLTVSLRASNDNDIDVSEVAKEFGHGGGHKKAAGAKISIRRCASLISKYYRLLEKKENEISSIPSNR